jgi:site-specific DNA recombinase
MQDNNLNAIIYCRVSDPKQVEDGNGLHSQESRCREFAKNRGYSVVDVFHEGGISGKLLDRPQMQKMLQFLAEQKGKSEYVLVIDDISRLARDIETHIALRSAISATGARLESPSVHFGEDSDSRLVENMLASVAAHQREKNAETTRNRMRGRVLNGYWVGPCPVGYRYEAQKGRGKVLVKVEPQASILHEALVGFAYGRFETQAEVGRFLESHAAYPKDKKGRVHKQRVNELLNRELYAGLISAPKWGIHSIQGQHEPIISLEEYAKIQDRLKKGAKAPARKDLNEDFPLRNFVTCSCCGSNMTAGWTKGRSKYYGYYQCQKKGCDEYGKSIKKDEIEKRFEAILKDLTPPKDLFDMAQAMFKDHYDQRARKRHQEIFEIKRQKTDIERKINSYLDRIIEAENSSVIKAYEGKVQELELQKAVMEEKIANCGRALPNFADHSRAALQLLRNPYELWAEGQFADRRNVLRLCFTTKLIYDKNEGYRTAQKALPFRALEGLNDPKSDMVRLGGLEPPRPKVNGFSYHLRLSPRPRT